MGYMISIYYDRERHCYSAQVIDNRTSPLVGYGCIPIEALGRLMLIIPTPFMITGIKMPEVA